jgi:putative flippase GtrA
VAVNLAFVWVGLRLFAAAPETTREALASALGILVSVLTNFILNDGWTWGDRAKGARRRDFAMRVLRYYLASGAAVALQYGVAMALAAGADWDIYLAQLVGIALGTVVNYAINNVWTFRDHDTGPRGGDSGAG